MAVVDVVQVNSISSLCPRLYFIKTHYCSRMQSFLKGNLLLFRGSDTEQLSEHQDLLRRLIGIKPETFWSRADSTFKSTSPQLILGHLLCLPRKLWIMKCVALEPYAWLMVLKFEWCLVLGYFISSFFFSSVVSPIKSLKKEHLTCEVKSCLKYGYLDLCGARGKAGKMSPNSSQYIIYALLTY